MLNLLDFVDDYKRNLHSSIEEGNSLVQALVEYEEATSIIMNHASSIGSWKISDEYDGDGADLWYDITQLISLLCNNENYAVRKDETHIEVIKYSYYFEDSETLNVIVDNGSLDEMKYQFLLYGHDVNMESFNTDSVTKQSLNDVFDNIMESTGVKVILSEAVELAEKGELTVSSFMSSIPEYINRSNAEIANVISVIKGCCSGVDPSGQVSNLVYCIQKLYGNILTAIQSGNIITFNDSEFFVDTSVLGPIKDLVLPIAQALAGALYFIHPVAAAIASGVVAITSVIVNYLGDNEDIFFKFNEVKDNDCFAMPIFQKIVSSTDIGIELKDLIDENRYVKLTNGLFTIYCWKNEEVGPYYMEGYLNAGCDISYTSGASEGLVNLTRNWISKDANNVITMNTTGRNNVYSILGIWLDNQSTPGGDVLTYNISQYGIEERNALATRRLASSFVLLSWLCLSLMYPNDSLTRSPGNFDLLFKRGSHGDVEILGMCSYLANYYLYDWNVMHLSDIEQGYMYYGSGLGTVSVDLVATLINQGYPALKRIFNAIPDDILFQYLFNPMMPSHLDTTYQDLYDVGVGYTLHPTFAFGNKGNSYVYPPKSTHSRWITALATTGLIIGISVASILAVTSVKKYVRYKASQKRMQIDAAYERYKETGSIEDYNAAYKLNRKYNRFWGRISGTTYDMNNGWVDYSAQSSGPINSTQIVLFDKLNRNLTGSDL